MVRPTTASKAANSNARLNQISYEKLCLVLLPMLMALAMTSPCRQRESTATTRYTFILAGSRSRF
jgi:hypothetical protein